MLVGAIQMWQSVQDDPTKFPDKLGDLDGYINGGVAKLTKFAKDGTTDAHTISGGKLTSVYDSTNTWTYPAH